jgi:hypothetical protein
MGAVTGFVIGGIYWFVNPQISSTDPHPHVCVGEYEGNSVLLFCGTSNYEGSHKKTPVQGLVRCAAQRWCYSLKKGGGFYLNNPPNPPRLPRPPKELWILSGVML